MTSARQIGLIILLSTCFNLQAQSAYQVRKVTLTVSDVEKLSSFYQEVLKFKPVASYHWEGQALQHFTGLREKKLSAKVVLLQLGEEQIELVEFVNEARQLPIPDDSRSNDGWFQHIAIVVSNIDSAYQHLISKKVTYVSTAPQTLPDYLPAAAGISAFYFRDPDGHNLEIIHYPKGKGDPKWQSTDEQLFLGIDHTALCISDTETALDFYQGNLGLVVAGSSVNYGSEQEHLNQVFGAHLLITGLKAQQGIGIEFLEYRSPPGGRPFPSDSRPTDLWHWHTTVAVHDPDEVLTRIRAANYTVVSQGVVELQGKRGFLMRDPDGHAIYVTEN